MTKTRTLALVLLAAIAGCKSEGAASDQGAAAVKEGAAAKEKIEAGPDLGSYIFCFNELDKDIRSVWDRYILSIDPVTGPTGKERLLSMNVVYDYASNKCFEELDAAAKRNDASSLGPLTKTYRDKINALIPVAIEVKTYYEHGDYKDDAFAKGKTLHQQFSDAFAQWRDAAGALRDAWETLHREQRTKDLANLEKEVGRKHEVFVTAQVMNRAEVLIEAVQQESGTDAVVKAFESYQAAYAEMDTFFGPELTSAIDTDRAMFKQKAEVLLIQTKEAMRALKVNPKLPEDGEGSPAKISEAYNGLVDQSNDITWD